MMSYSAQLGTGADARFARRLSTTDVGRISSPMRLHAQVLCLGVLGLLSACRAPTEWFDDQEVGYRDHLAARYPHGSQWCEPQDELGPFAIWRTDDPSPDWFSARALERALELGHRPSSCRLGAVARTSLGTSFGAVGICHDYVFLDGQDRILVAFRRFVD